MDSTMADTQARAAARTGASRGIRASNTAGTAASRPDTTVASSQPQPGSEPPLSTLYAWSATQAAICPNAVTTTIHSPANTARTTVTGPRQLASRCGTAPG
jgi:hypothetical protein